ncbi:hypothetical protein A7K69_16690 [Parageobacillus thermoglucosidasius]|uniref:Uncharacterized protein n=1 Tax=Parageobacillus thermoglucosidasius TaxID=1426 RepID=A0A1B7KV70_PARTM|nr:hypothetical protein A7K69_16690 [Parageobacillus thermoglucosidasius]
MFGTRVFSKFPRFDRSISIRFIGEMANSFRGTYSGVSNLHMILGSMIGPALSGYFFDIRHRDPIYIANGFHMHIFWTCICSNQQVSEVKKVIFSLSFVKEQC